MQEESAGEGEWVSLRVRSPASVQEALTNFLIEQTGLGVQMEGEWVTAFCHRGTEAQDCLDRLSRYYQALQQLHPGLPDLVAIQEDLEDEDWRETWKAFFKPIRIGKRIVVKPTWEPYLGDAGEVVIELDPGRAFGTGRHPTTALCIEILEEVLTGSVSDEADSARSVLDVGTGSGILGIVAARLGARRVVGLDIDPEALEVAKSNLERNGAGGIMVVSGIPLEQVAESFNLVVANLTAVLLTRLAGGLARCINGGGWLLLSGILTEQFEEVVDCFRRQHLELAEFRAIENWCAVLLRRQGRSV